MSKFCPNCKAEMPEEANFCLNCINACDNTTPATSASKKHASCKTRVFEYINKFKLLSKKQKAAILGSILCFITLIPFSVYMLTPSDNISENPSIITEQNGDNKGRKKPTRAETILNKLLGKENNKSTDNESVTATANALAKAGASSVTASDNESSAATDSSKSGNTKNSGGTNKNNGNHNGNSETPSGSGGSSNNTNESPTDNNNGSESTSDSANEDTEPVLDYNDWEYTINSSDELIITKYTGDDTNVLVPDKIADKNVEKIEADTFSNNSSIKTITFKDSEKYHCLIISTHTFNNLPKLEKIIFPTNTDFVFFHTFAVNTPKLKSITIDHWQAKFINGAFYWSSGGNGKYAMYVYCEGNTASSFTMPDFSYGVSCGENISNCKYLKVLNLPEGSTPPSKQTPNIKYSYLEEINIASGDGNQYYFSQEGVVYAYGKIYGGKYNCSLYIYPGAKTNKEYTFPTNCYIDFPIVSGAEPKLETICVPKSSMIDNLEYLSYRLPNLKTVKIQKGHPDYTKYQTYLGYDYNVVQY